MKVDLVFSVPVESGVFVSGERYVVVPNGSEAEVVRIETDVES